MKHTFVAILLALSGLSQAQTVGVDLVSYHADNNRNGYELNNVNPGIYINYNNVTVGLVKNSWRKPAPYIMYSPHPNFLVGVAQYTSFQYEFRFKKYSQPEYYEWDHKKKLVPLYFITKKFDHLRISVNHEFVHLSYEFWP